MALAVSEEVSAAVSIAASIAVSTATLANVNVNNSR